jgi:salicylate hydroxylase/6-hydroxynicotinate 3-monooxygenase
LRKAFDGFHDQVQRVVGAADLVHKRPLVDREPMTRWGDGNVTLPGERLDRGTLRLEAQAALALPRGADAKVDNVGGRGGFHGRARKAFTF